MTEAVNQIFAQLQTAAELAFAANADSISNAVATSGNPDIKKYRINLNGVEQDVVIKRKSAKILLRGITMLSSGDPRLRLSLLRHHKIFGYNQSHRRESRIYQNLAPALQKYLPPYLGTFHQGLNHSLILGFIESNPHSPETNYMRIIDILTDVHATYYNQSSSIKTLQLNHYTPRDYHVSKPVLRRIFRKLDNEKFFTSAQIQELLDFINYCDQVYAKYPAHRTLTHNDFSCRNIFLTDTQTYFYDWELAAYQNPEHDLLEFLAYHVYNYTDNQIRQIIKYYYQQLKTKTSLQVKSEALPEILRFNLYEFAINRLSLLRLADRELHLPIVEQITQNTARLINLIGE